MIREAASAALLAGAGVTAFQLPLPDLDRAARAAGLVAVLEAEHGVPAVAARAYLSAAAGASCPLDYRTLAAMDEVESAHATDRLDPVTGVAEARVVSPAGALGPLQFMPPTWGQYGVDGDGDGAVNVHDIDDAAAGAAAKLCASNVDEDWDEAVGSYNGGWNWRAYAESQAYVGKVRARMAALPPADSMPAANAAGLTGHIGGQQPSLMGGNGRLDELYRDAGGLIDTGCEHVDGRPTLSAACAAAQRAWWGEQKAQAGGRPVASPLPSRPVGEWLAPCDGPVTSGFGPRVAPVAGARTFHPGVDYGCPMGAPVRAAAAGRVVFAGWDGGFGNSVQLEHAGGAKTSYNHLEAVSVATGQSVRAGATVGLVGSTGVSTGPHLHFELWEGGVPVDPTGRLAFYGSAQ